MIEKLTWHKGKAFFPKPLQWIITGYIEEFDYDLLDETDTELTEKFRRTVQQAGVNGINLNQLRKFLVSSAFRETPPDAFDFLGGLTGVYHQSVPRVVVFTTQQRAQIWDARDKIEKEFNEGPMMQYKAALARHKAEDKKWLEYYKKRHQQFVVKRVDKINIASVIDKVMSSPRVKLMDKEGDSGVTNHKIRLRAIELAEAYLQKQTVIDRNRETLAAACVVRAASENGLGLRHWDIEPFCPDGHQFNDRVRDLRSKLKLTNNVTRQKLLNGFVTMYANRAVFHLKNKDKSKAITAKERHKMQCFARWIGDAKIHRVPSEGKHGKRKLKCLSIFLDRLAQEDSNIKPITNFIVTDKKEEPIHTESMAATIIYMVLSVRPGRHPQITEEVMHELTGVHTCVIMACKSAFKDIIQRAYDDANTAMDVASD